MLSLQEDMRLASPDLSKGGPVAHGPSTFLDPALHNTHVQKKLSIFQATLLKSQHGK